MKNCAVIGGGVIGLCSAYYLAKAGHRVIVLDQSDMTDGCSYGNAGMIVPSHIIPLAQPGMISQGIRWMFNSTSPFYVRPRMDRDLFSWGMKFYRNSTEKHVASSMPILRDLSYLSKELYQDLNRESGSFFYEEKGLLMLFKSQKMGEEECKVGQMAQKLGIEVRFLTKENVLQVENGIEMDVAGGVHYVGDAHLSPQLFMQFLKKELCSMNVELKPYHKVDDFRVENSKIVEIQSEKGRFQVDEVILCAGSWSPEIAKKLSIKLSILPGKGYSFDSPRGNEMPTVPSILCEGKVAVTPMGDQIRFGGTLEITNTSDCGINPSRVKGIVKTVNEFYPTINVNQPDNDKIWAGFRPCTPSGLPIISRSSRITNLVVASGHAMMGLSLAPATGKLVQELVDKKKTSVQIDGFKF